MKQTKNKKYEEFLRSLTADDLFDELRRSDIKLKRSRTHQIRYKIQCDKASLVKLNEAEKAWKLSISSAREKLLAIPPTLAHALAGLTERQDLLPQFEKLLKSHIYEAMDAVADQKIVVEEDKPE